MAGRPKFRGPFGLFVSAVLWLSFIVPQSALAGPGATMVMDARTGEIIDSYNANTPLHPASLTKMMTLYIAFQAIERGEISADTVVTITREAAAEPPSKLGLRTGQEIRLRYLIRAAAVKSANDAATAIGIALEGSEAAFARRMNRMAQSMGMTRTTFRNANGLTESGHMSTARDMTILGRHMIYDFPEYYNIFSRRSTDAGMAEVYNTNRRFLAAYRGADGIKTGFTSAAGYNLVASAERNGVRIIATIFGESSVTARNNRAAELLDMGFSRAPRNARIQRPPLPAYQPGSSTADEPLMLSANTTTYSGAAGRTIRVTGAVTRSPRPTSRPAPEAPALIVADAGNIEQALETAMEVANATDQAVAVATTDQVVLASASRPVARPPAVVAEVTAVAIPSTDADEVALAVAAATKAQPEVVTRVSTSGGRHWGINVGRYGSRYEAERILVRIALNEMATLDGSLRRVVEGSRGYDANFMGMTREMADLACRRLQARDMTCFMIGQDS
ncbi:D-alanyl-D-alanine carboxypeptidase [Marivivens niveibacter]|uniref:D-alanyl-D-alanine carboxypeptidase n=2 Tax=Marivivens niveibacter TaxID=1930667 RepID=A0A251X161_9RHOB|nr:D-alanyl-D-alanine carboxypeptidase [Marivivens niveibacter]